MNRITPEQVQEAYEKTGLRPLSKVFATVDIDGKPCGCALTAFAYSRMMTETTFDQIVTMFEDDGLEVVEDLLEQKYDWKYLSGFVSGFDGLPNDGFDELGYEDGVRAQKVVFGQI